MRSPYLKQQGSTKVLMVDDHPFVMLAGELHNSNSSTPEAMEASCRKAAEPHLANVRPRRFRQLEHVQQNQKADHDPNLQDFP